MLRLGHRPTRDKRITTHVCLVARAFGAAGAYIAGSKDDTLKTSLNRVIGAWGGPFWLEHVVSPMRIVKDWKSRGGIVAHLTMYGMPIERVKETIKVAEGDLLVVIGGEKVPFEFYEEANFNVAIGNQPHSEVAALAIFLDRITEGKWESNTFENTKIRILPSEKGKNVKQL